jgi:glyoxylase-like metal-dependent hydrolase (beta-lactamase superfamily II)
MEYGSATATEMLPRFPLTVGGYEIDLLVQGYPGKSTHHGGIGWSSVVLLRGHGRVVMIDTGGFGMRALLVQKLSARGLRPDDVTDLLLTHAHHDHIVNFTLFNRARLHIGAKELAWALDVPWGGSPVPELYARELQGSDRLTLVEEGDEVLPGITAQLAPGHTPGHLIFLLAGEERDVIFLQDAVKTRTELVSGETDMTYDPAVSAATVKKVWALWRRRPGTILVPGHDAPMMLSGDQIRLLARREGGIKALFGDSLEDVTTFDAAG